MNASAITHGLKLIGFNISMLVGIAVIAFVFFHLGNPDTRKRIWDAI